MPTNKLGWAVLIANVLGTAGCDESLSDLTGPTPSLVPTFSSIQQNIFSADDSSGRVACTACHNATGSRFNGLDLSSEVAYNNLVNAASQFRAGAIHIIPTDPENSYLIHKLEGRSTIAGVRMPTTPPYLTSGQTLVIRRWIQLGAPNN
jgi:hypothetical protein